MRLFMATALVRVRLPVAGTEVGLRPPIGVEEILLLEAGPPDLELALALLGQLTADDEGIPLDPAALAIGDVDVLLLRLRQQVLGDLVSAEEVCTAPGCHARVDIIFSIAAYLDHHRPDMPEGVWPADDRDWYRLAGEDVEFRAPQASDQIAIARAAEPEQELLRRCVRPTPVTEDLRERVEAALELMAPTLCSDLQGVCPACGAAVEASFDPLRYTLRELRDRAAFVYEDVCAIAHHFHWSEAEILALPAARRSRYAELAGRSQEERTLA
jgi:hypothetical protein